MNKAKTIYLSCLLLLPVVMFSQLGNRGDLVVPGRGIVTTNRPGNDSVPVYIRGFTNADGSITYYWSPVVATDTNSQPPSATLTNLSNTSALTNVGNATIGIKTADQLFQPLYRLDTNTLVLGASTNLGISWVSNNVQTLNSNRNQIGSSTATFSNMFSVAYQLPALQGASEAVGAGFIKLVNSNNTVYAIKAAAMVNLEETGAGSAVYIDTAHTNITAKGLTIQNALDMEVVTLTGTTPSIDATNSPSYYIELEGNTTPTFANFPVGRMVSILVSNGAQHTLTWPVNITWLNQNTPPSVTTNGYTHYQFFRPTTTITQAIVLGRELELAFAGGIVAFTNATTLTLSNSTVGAADGTGIAWYTNTVLAGIKTNVNFIFGPNIHFRTTNESGQVSFYVYSSQTNFDKIMITNGVMVTGPQTNTTDIFLDSTHIGADLDVSGSSFLQAVGILSAVVTNNITYSAPTLVLSGNSTQYAGNFTFARNIIDLTNCLHVTGMVNVAAANFDRPWILSGRNLTSSNNTVSVSPLFQRAGTNFVVVPAAKRFRISVFSDGSGGVNETNMMADIQVYDSP